MRSAEEACNLIKAYKEAMLKDKSVPFSSDYDFGLCNGLEMALAMLEKRPFFLVDKDKLYSKYDVEKHPEHFL